MITSSTVFDIERFGGWAPSRSPPQKPELHDNRFSWRGANSVDSVDRSSPGDSGCLPDKNGGNQFPRAPARLSACTCQESFSPLWNLLSKGIGRTEMSLTVGCRFPRGAVCSTRNLDQTHERAKCSGTAQHHAR